MSSAEIVYEDATLRQAFARNLHVVLWYGPPEVEHMRAYGQCVEELQRSSPGGTALLNLMVSGLPRFSAEVREEVARQTRRSLHRVGAAHVLLIGGLVGTSVRAFLSTAILIGKPKNPTRFFGAVPEASGWISERCRESAEEQWDAREIRDVCERLLELGAPAAR